MSKKKNDSIPASSTVLFVPLNKLKKSPNNARKTPHLKADIEALAAQRRAAKPRGRARVRWQETDRQLSGHHRRGTQARATAASQAQGDHQIRTDPLHSRYRAQRLEISLAENASRRARKPAAKSQTSWECR